MLEYDWEKAEKEKGLANVASAAGIPRWEVLHGHTSMETAYVQADYPYGRYDRCQRRVWLEFKPKRGFRFVTQTNRPGRPDVWNNPHRSTYTDWAVLVHVPHEKADDALSWTGCGYWGPHPAGYILTHVRGVYAGLTDEERKVYDAYVTRSRKNSSDWEHWATEVIPAFLAYQVDHDGLWPTEQAHIRPYVPDYQFPAVIAAATLELYRTS